jgi:alpha-L-rhamnosidase
VEVSWRLDGHRFSLRAAIPPNTTATIRIPDAIPSQVTENGRSLDTAPGITNVSQETGAVVVAAGSGTYSFESVQP